MTEPLEEYDGRKLEGATYEHRHMVGTRHVVWRGLSIVGMR